MRKFSNEIIYEKLSLFNSLKKSLNDTALYTIKTFEGIAEIITCKHRNGPLGTVKLLFEPQYTRYRNLAA